MLNHYSSSNSLPTISLLYSTMSTSFHRSSSHSLSCTDMNASGIAALSRIVMSNNATHDSYCTSTNTNKNSRTAISVQSHPALSLQRLPSEELTVDTATAAAAVAATTEVSTLVGGARAGFA